MTLHEILQAFLWLGAGFFFGLAWARYAAHRKEQKSRRENREYEAEMDRRSKLWQAGTHNLDGSPKDEGPVRGRTEPPERYSDYEWHRLKSERASTFPAAKWLHGKWYSEGEPITPEEMFARGWRYDGPIFGRRS